MRICTHFHNFYLIAMGALFGKQKKPPSRVTEQDKAILVSLLLHIMKKCKKEFATTKFLINFRPQQLKQQRDKLKQYQKRIELSLTKDRELARKCLATGRKE